MGDSKISWTNKVWNCARGCSIVSPGCTNCYAMWQAARWDGPFKPYEGLTRQTTRGPVWTGAVRTIPELLDRPMHWRKPARVFVNSMSDLFHEDIPFEFIDAVHGVMARCPQHTFQILTKRPERMREWATRERYRGPISECLAEAGVACPSIFAKSFSAAEALAVGDRGWPLPNVWYGVSVENFAYLNRLDILMQTPARIRFVSFEPLLGDLGDLSQWLYPSCRDREEIHHDEWCDEAALDWVILGGESGVHARPCNLEWIRSPLRQCQAAHVPCFVKQLGADPRHPDFPDVPAYWLLRDRKGEDPAEWPEDVRVREYPR